MEFFAGVAVTAIVLIVFVIGLTFGGLGEEGQQASRSKHPSDQDEWDNNNLTKEK